MTRLIVLLPLTALLAALAQILVKAASGQNLYQHGMTRKTLVLIAGNPQVWVSGILYLASFLLSIKIYEMSRLSIITPVFMGLVLFFVVTLSCLFFKDQLTPRVLLGQATILLGVTIVLSAN